MTHDNDACRDAWLEWSRSMAHCGLAPIAASVTSKKSPRPEVERGLIEAACLGFKAGWNARAHHESESAS